MAASAHAAGLTGRLPFGAWLTVFNPGGRVRARAEGPAGGDMVTIAGNATFEWDGVIEVDPATGVAGELRVVRRREDEVAAWAAARG
jgi:diaminopimelate epimerase